MTEDVLAALELARSEFARRLDAISVGDWDKPTPCGEWNVRLLVNHLVGHQYRYADNLSTNNPEYYIASRDDDFLGEDPVRSWNTGVALLDAAIAGLNSLDATINFRVPLAARDVLTVLVFEATVHTWDVSRAIGYDDRIDETLAELTYPLLARLLQIPAIQSFFAVPTVELSSTATSQERLLHLAGRNP